MLLIRKSYPDNIDQPSNGQWWVLLENEAEYRIPQKVFVKPICRLLDEAQVGPTHACHELHDQGENQDSRIKHEENECRPQVNYEDTGAETILIEELVERFCIFQLFHCEQHWVQPFICLKHVHVNETQYDRLDNLGEPRKS